MTPEQTKRFAVGGGDRVVSLYGWPDARSSEKPPLLMIHGLFTYPGYLMGWADLLGDRFNVLFAALPGHGGGSPFANPDAPSVAAALLEACALTAPGRPLHVVGDSIGGVIALAMASSPAVRRAVAVEPPLQTAKLWCFHQSLPVIRAKGTPISDEILDRFIGAGPQIRDIDYRPLLDRLVAPTTVIAGDIPLGAPRLYTKTPSHLDQADHAAIRAARQATLHVVSGGHLLMGEPSDEVVRVVREALA